MAAPPLGTTKKTTIYMVVDGQIKKTAKLTQEMVMEVDMIIAPSASGTITLNQVKANIKAVVLTVDKLVSLTASDSAGSQTRIFDSIYAMSNSGASGIGTGLVNTGGITVTTIVIANGDISNPVHVKGKIVISAD